MSRVPKNINIGNMHKNIIKSKFNNQQNNLYNTFQKKNPNQISKNNNTNITNNKSKPQQTQSSLYQIQNNKNKNKMKPNNNNINKTKLKPQQTETYLRSNQNNKIKTKVNTNNNIDNNHKFKRQQTETSFYSNQYNKNKAKVNNNNNKANNNLNNTVTSFKKINQQNIINISNTKKPITNPNKNKTFYNTNPNFNKNKNPNIITPNTVNRNMNINSNINMKVNVNDMKNDEKLKNYIMYLKNHLNSSYYANNDLNNVYSKIMNKSKEVNDSINNKNDLYINMNKLHEENVEKNKNFQKEYKSMVDEYKINHLNEQNKLKELNNMIFLQDNDIQKIENENNLLNDDIKNKQRIIENLKKKIELMKNKKKVMEENEEYLYLFNKKNNLISLNEKVKILKKAKNKNEELLQNINILKNNLNKKENDILQNQNIHNELTNKLIQLNQEEKNNNIYPHNLHNLNKSYEKYDTFNFNNNNNNNNNEYNINSNTSYEIENKDIESEMEFNLYRTYNQPFKKENIDNKQTIDYYQKLIAQENKKKSKIDEKIDFYGGKLEKLKNEIYEIKSKNNKELSLYKDYINNLSPNDEDIHNELLMNKKNIITQKESLVKYNKKFKESLSEKNDLKNKINQLKLENQNIELKLTEKQKTIGFKIKAIKIRRGDAKNNKNKGMERNLSDPDLIKNNFNDKLYISQNRENFIPVNDIYRYKKFEIKYRNEKKLLNRFKSRKSSSFDNIFKYNKNNRIEQETNIDILNTPRSGTYIYTIDKEGKLLGYGIELKKYVYINTSSIKGWRLFYKDYKNNTNGTLLLNTLAGLFILTGDTHNHLYYYSQSKNIIYLIMTLKYNHKYGGLILTKDNNKIIILGGIYTYEVELFNIQKNSLKKLPKLLSKRINSSYNIINNQYLFAFFGKNNNKIEFLDLKNPNNWVNFEYNSNSGIKDLSGHIGFHVNENVVIIVGGENNDKIMVFYFKEKFVDVTDFVLSFDIDCGIDELIFDKEKCFNLVENKEKISNDEKERKEIMGMDIFGNVHCFDSDYSYTIFVF